MMNSATELTKEIVSDERLNELYSSYADDKMIQEQFGDGDYANESGDIMSIIAEVKSLRAQLAELREQEETLSRIRDIFQIGREAPLFCIVENVKNATRFADHLAAIEQEFFMVTDEYYHTDDDQDDELREECLVNRWGSTTEQYVEQFRKALNHIAYTVPIAPALPDGWKLVPVEPTEAMLLVLGMTGSFDAMIARYQKMLAAAQQPDQFRDATKMLSSAVRDVIAERQRQITTEGWTPEHDDEHVGFEMSFAAATYILHIAQSYGGQPYKHIAPSEMWTWDLKWLKFTPGARRSLVKAAALILAEIDRLDRTSQSGGVIVANSFKQMIKSGVIKRSDNGMFIRLDDIYIRPDFNARVDSERLADNNESLFNFLMNGGRVPPLEVTARDDVVAIIKEYAS
ncbi:hypothetical protein [Dickeya ananatis]|uniref:hypothetical protein n=1 Tax=Dickeya ananatis TaxID=3061286 RepID=UPI00388F4D05